MASSASPVVHGSETSSRVKGNEGQTAVRAAQSTGAEASPTVSGAATPQQQQQLQPANPQPEAHETDANTGSSSAAAAARPDSTSGEQGEQHQEVNANRARGTHSQGRAAARSPYLSARELGARPTAAPHAMP